MDYKIIYSKRKTVSIRILDDGTVQVRAPKGAQQNQINTIIDSNADRIKKQKQYITARSELYNSACCTKESVFEKVMPMIKKYSALMGTEPKNIRITSAKKRFGSCSSGGTVCFSKYLCLYPDAAIEYVVVHELAHLVHLDHSKAFYELIEKYLPDWRERKKLLRIL